MTYLTRHMTLTKDERRNSDASPGLALKLVWWVWSRGL